MRNRLTLLAACLAFAAGGETQARTKADPPQKPVLSVDDDLLGLEAQNGSYRRFYALPSINYFKDAISMSALFSGSDSMRGGENPLLYHWRAGFAESVPLLRGKSGASFNMQLSGQVYRRDSVLLTLFGTYVRGLVSPIDRYVFGATASLALSNKLTLETTLSRNQIITASSTREAAPVSFNLTNFYDAKHYLSLRYSPHNVIGRTDEIALTWGFRYARGVVKPSLSARGNLGIAFQILL